MNIRERIIFFCKTVGITKTEFERRAGLCNGYTNSIRRSVGSKLPQILEAFPELNKEWLLFEEGEMLKTYNDSVEDLPKNENEGLYNVDLENCEVRPMADGYMIVEKEVQYGRKASAYVDDGLTVGERMDKFIKSKGLGRYQFEMKCGLSQGYIANIRNSPHPDKLKRIVHVYPELNIEWLIIGRGEMEHPKKSSLANNWIRIKQELDRKIEEEASKRITLEETIEQLRIMVNKLIKK